MKYEWVHQASENEIDSLQKAISQTCCCFAVSSLRFNSLETIEKSR